MLFFAQFSFIGSHTEGPLKGQAMSGHFSCLVDADDVEGADSRLRALLRESQRKQDLFEGVAEIYLDTLIAVKSMPKKGVLAYFAEYLQDTPDTMWTALPYTPSRYCDAYSYGDGDEDEDHAEDAEHDHGEHAEPIPFLVFGEPAAEAD